jgi:uncharacterized membrane protein YfcA
MDTISLWGVAVLVLCSILAGWVDAVVGGGGLIQLPALLLAPGVSPLQALATNKLAGTMGVAVSSVTYLRRVRLPRGILLWMLPAAVLGSIGGAFAAAALPSKWITPIVFLAVLLTGGLTLARPALGAETSLKFGVRGRRVAVACLGATVGAYDGMIGPGTGTFLVFGLVAGIGCSFLDASVLARVVNLGTNAAALIIFLAHGAPLIWLGLLLGAANLAGGYLGARTAIRLGSKFVRTVFLVVAALLAVRLGVQAWQQLF